MGMKNYISICTSVKLTTTLILVASNSLAESKLSLRASENYLERGKTFESIQLNGIESQLNSDLQVYFWLSKGKLKNNDWLVPLQHNGAEIFVPLKNLEFTSHSQIRLLTDSLTYKAANLFELHSLPTHSAAQEAKPKASLILKNCHLQTEQLTAVIEKELQTMELTEFFSSSLIEQIVKQESQGNCLAHREEYNGTISVGLMQVNTSSTHLSVDELTQPQVNIRQGLLILKQKQKIISKIFPDASPVDNLALTIAAYNGGQAHLLDAKKDIIELNQKHSLQLNASSWTDIRTFLLRKTVAKRTAESKGLHTSQLSTTKWRAPSRTLTNIKYVENLLTQSNLENVSANRERQPTSASDAGSGPSHSNSANASGQDLVEKWAQSRQRQYRETSRV
jgi:hypothetical protein